MRRVRNIFHEEKLANKLHINDTSCFSYLAGWQLVALRV